MQKNRRFMDFTMEQLSEVLCKHTAEFSFFHEKA